MAFCLVPDGPVSSVAVNIREEYFPVEIHFLFAPRYASHSAWKASGCRGVKLSLASFSVSQCDYIPLR